MSNWRQDAECAMQGADPEMFAPGEPRRKIPPEARTAIDLYCRFCAVVTECRDFADKTQTPGVFGGTYRDISKGAYRTHDVTTGEMTRVRFTEYVQHVPGDERSTGEHRDLVDTRTAMKLLKMASVSGVRRLLERNEVYPVRWGTNGRPNLYDPDEIRKLMHELTGGMRRRVRSRDQSL